MAFKVIVGIYKITCELDSNKVYVGSSESLHNRFKSHKSALKSEKHSNYRLQKAFNIFGLNSFKFEIIEECNPSILLEREKFWIDYYQSYIPSEGYNLMKNPIQGNQGSIIFNKIHYFLNPEGLKTEVRDLPQFCKDNDLFYNKMLSVSYGKTRYIKEGFRKYSMSNEGISFQEYLSSLIPRNTGRPSRYKVYKAVDPNGNIVQINNVVNFANNLNICPDSFKKMLAGTVPHCKGWRPFKEKYIGVLFTEKIVIRGKNGLKFIDINNNVIEVKSLSTFCEKNGVNYAGMKKLKQGKIEEYKGFKIITN